MTEKRFETSRNPHITIAESAGNVTISGRLASAVVINGSKFHSQEQEFDEIAIESASNVEVTVPTSAVLSLGDIRGTLTIKHVDGHISIQRGVGAVTLSDTGSVKVHKVDEELYGENLDGPVTIVEALKDVNLRNAGPTKVDRVGNDFTARYIRGSLVLGEVGGVITVHTINGDLTVQHGDNHVNLSNLGGSNSLPAIRGEIRLLGGLASGAHRFVAEGNIIVCWPLDAPVTLTATAAKILSQIPLTHKTITQQDERTTLTGHIEDGKAHLSLTSSATIGLKLAGLVGAAEEAFDACDFDLDDGTLVDVALPDEIAPAAEPSTLGNIQTSHTLVSSIEPLLVEAIAKRLSNAAIDLETEALRNIVSDAVAESLDTAVELVAVETAETTQASASRRRAAEAIREFERSLRQARESMDQARQKGRRQTPVQPEAGEATDEKISTTPAPDERMATEEQLKILHLLENGHISAQQAYTLLQALQE